ncbi:hypothetical protein VZT92_007939 [Zoarces viviparus]|uniref:Uncharacterized protein n=1 Tax=Zoarces viviparus TaxID=48416 RepID=A0AAW1FLL4_ZOAVI
MQRSLPTLDSGSALWKQKAARRGAPPMSLSCLFGLALASGERRPCVRHEWSSGRADSLFPGKRSSTSEGITQD